MAILGVSKRLFSGIFLKYSISDLWSNIGTGWNLLVIQVQISKSFPCLIESHEVLHIVNDGNTWKRFLKVSCKTFAVLRRMQDTIDIIENMLFSDSLGIAEAFTHFF